MSASQATSLAIVIHLESRVRVALSLLKFKISGIYKRKSLIRNAAIFNKRCCFEVLFCLLLIRKSAFAMLKIVRSVSRIFLWCLDERCFLIDNEVSWCFHVYLYELSNAHPLVSKDFRVTVRDLPK